MGTQPKTTGRYSRPPTRFKLLRDRAGFLGLVFALFAALLAVNAPATATEGDGHAAPLATATASYYYDGEADGGSDPSYPGGGGGYTPSGTAPEGGDTGLGGGEDGGIEGSDDGGATSGDGPGYEANAPPTGQYLTNDDLRADGGEGSDGGDFSSLEENDDDGSGSPDGDGDGLEGDDEEEVGPEPEPVTVDLYADWDATANAVIAPGQQSLAWFSFNANHIQTGAGGAVDLTIVVEAQNGVFTGFSHGEVSNAGRTLTIQFPAFELGSSLRFGFAMMPLGPGEVGASVTATNAADGETLNTAQVPPRPVGPGSNGWDLIQAITTGGVGTAHDQHLLVPFNLAVARDGFIPQGDLVFDLSVAASHAGGAGFAPQHRLAFPLNNAANTGQVVDLPLAAEGSTNTITNRSGAGALRARIDTIPGGYRFTFPAQYLQPWLDLPTEYDTPDMDPRVRVFGAAQVGFAFQTDPATANNIAAGGIIGLAVNATGAHWGGVPETDFGIVTNQCGQDTVNNRRCFIMFGGGGGAVQWADAGSGLVQNNVRQLWNADSRHNVWAPMPGLQDMTAAWGAGWSANAYVPGGSQVAALSHQILTDGAAFTASCYLIDPAVTPFLGRALVHGANVQLWVTTQAAGLDADCSTLGGWQPVGSIGQVAHGQHAFNLPNPGSLTAVRLMAQSGHFLFAMHETRMGHPGAAGWITGAYWTTNSADISDIHQFTRNTLEIAPTPGHLFPATTDTRDVLFGNYGFPRITKAVSNTAPMLGETVTFTIQALNRSNQGQMALVVHDQIDHRLHLVPGSVTVNGQPFADPAVSGPQPGQHVPGSTVRQLTFALGQRPVNEVFTITYQAVARWADGSAYNTAWMVPTPEAQARGGGAHRIAGDGPLRHRVQRANIRLGPAGHVRQLRLAARHRKPVAPGARRHDRLGVPRDQCGEAYRRRVVPRRPGGRAAGGDVRRDQQRHRAADRHHPRRPHN